MKRLVTLIAIAACTATMQGQVQNDPFGNGDFTNGTDDYDPMTGQQRSTWGRDTSKVDHFVPTEFHQWRIDERLGTVQPLALNDTLPHAFQNFNATDGLAAEYAILGNLGSPRYALDFLDRQPTGDFMFVQPYDYFHTTPGTLLFTNTKSPFTNLQYHSCGTKENGQDRLHAYFATNINKQAALGFKIDYLYGRGYYNNQANSQFGGNLFGYFMSDHYDVHAMAGWEHMKMGENGGITDDTYITDPESFPRTVNSTDIPTNLSSVWNRNDHQTYYLTHRYNVGIYHDIEVPDSLKPKMPGDNELLLRIKNDSLRAIIQADTLRRDSTLDSLRIQWQSEQVPPRQFVPVTSFIHTLHVRRLTHNNYCLANLTDDYFGHAPYIRSAYNSFSDETEALSVKNTLGVQLREGFNRWAKAGITLFAAHDFQRFRLLTPETLDAEDVFETYSENHFTVGGNLQKTQGSLIHYDAGAEFWLIGPKAGDMDIHGTGDLNFRLLGDTVHLAATAFFKNSKAPFYYRHYHSQTLWWDNSLSNETRTRIEGKLTLDRTHTSLRFGFENISNYTYLAATQIPTYNEEGSLLSTAHGVKVRQRGGSVQVMSATLCQDIHWGIFHWENRLTWLHSTDAEVLPLPMLTAYTNPYISFYIAKVLRFELGADLRWNTAYYAPDYAPFINQYAVQDASQERIKIGNYPIMNAYLNLAIKRVRGYVNVRHFNAGTGRAFWAPHYPIDPLSIHLGVSWNFYD